ncbi:MAG: prepilin-type N-terminal cleavage/methylation domain-containing protein [Rhodobacteraceae bacterium]|nr:prepilin-type N-terminal cleavage/methylation domain-containing protein [Paracoccaceae bacterium]
MRSSDRGITLLELVIAIFILAIGTVAAIRTLDQSRRGIGEEAARMMARTVAENRAEEIKLFGLARARGLPKTLTNGPYAWSVEMFEKPTQIGLIEVTVVAGAEGLPGASVVVFGTLRGRGR